MIRMYAIERKNYRIGWDSNFLYVPWEKNTLYFYILVDRGPSKLLKWIKTALRVY